MGKKRPVRSRWSARNTLVVPCGPPRSKSATDSSSRRVPRRVRLRGRGRMSPKGLRAEREHHVRVRCSCEAAL